MGGYIPTKPKSTGASGKYRSYARGGGGGSKSAPTTTPTQKVVVDTTKGPVDLRGGSYKARAESVAKGEVTPAERRSGVTSSPSTIQQGEREKVVVDTTKGPVDLRPAQAKQIREDTQAKIERERRQIKVYLDTQAVKDANKQFAEMGLGTAEELQRAEREGRVKYYGQGRFVVTDTEVSPVTLTTEEATNLYAPRNVSPSETMTTETDPAVFKAFGPKPRYTGATIGGEAKQTFIFTPASVETGKPIPTEETPETFRYKVDKFIAETKARAGVDAEFGLSDIGRKQSLTALGVYAGASVVKGVSETLLYPLIDYGYDATKKGPVKATLTFAGETIKGVGSALFNPIGFVSEEVTIAVKNPFESGGRLLGYKGFSKLLEPASQLSPVKVSKVTDYNLPKNPSFQKGLGSAKTGTTKFSVLTEKQGGKQVIEFSSSAVEEAKVTGKPSDFMTKGFELRIFGKKFGGFDTPEYTKFLEENPVYKEMLEKGGEIEVTGGSDDIKAPDYYEVFDPKLNQFVKVKRKTTFDKFTGEPETEISGGSSGSVGEVFGVNLGESAKGVYSGFEKIGQLFGRKKSSSLVEVEGQGQVLVLESPQTQSFVLRLKSGLGEQAVKTAVFPAQLSKVAFAQKGATIQSSGSLQGLSIVQRQTQVQYPQLAQVQVQSQVQRVGGLLKQGQVQKQTGILKQLQVQSQTQAQVQVQSQVQVQRQVQVQKQAQVQVQRTISFQKLITTTKTPFLRATPSEKKGGLGFDVLVKKGGVFKQVNLQPLVRAEALGFGAGIVQTTPSASFRIVPAKSPAKPLKQGVTASLKGFYKRGQTFIERPKERINTIGELQGITFRGLFAKANTARKLFKRTKGR